MLVSFAYVVVCRLFALVLLLARSHCSKELEILVLRVGFANLRGVVFVDGSAEEVATTWVGSRVRRGRVAAVGR